MPSRDKSNDVVEQFGKIPKQVLAAPKALLSPSAKVIYGVLNGERNARVGEPVHLTQKQIAVRSGTGLRTVQDALRSLERVGLISTHQQPALNGWTVNSYTVHGASRSTLPPTPDLPKTHSPHMREVLLRGRGPKADEPVLTAQRPLPMGAESAYWQSADHADVASEICQQEEELQEAGIKRTEEEARDIPLRLDVAPGGSPELDFDVPEHPYLTEALSDLGVMLAELFYERQWTTEKCNALIQDSWGRCMSPLENLRNVARDARAALLL